MDIDAPTANPGAVVAAVHKALGGAQVFAYSTSSSMPSAYRLRLMIPYDAPATAEEHRASWKIVEHILHRNGIQIDAACKDASRGYYVWVIPPSGVYWHGHLDGAPWPVARAAQRATGHAAKLEQRRREKQARRVKPRPLERSAMPAIDRARRYVEKMPPAISGSGGHAATWRVARVLVADYELSDEEALVVMREYSTRCQPPWLEKELRHKVQSARNARVHREMGVRPCTL